ncbi:MAG: ATP-binding cassette domain-containing protein, partial [Rhodanobacteraceae bacterium]
MWEGSMDGERPSSGLCVRDLTVKFHAHLVLDRVRFTVPDGQVLAVNGASGCGKTTLLRAVAGLLPVVTGNIQLAGTEITHLTAHRRGGIYLSQEPLLFPHLSVFGNVAFGLRLRHVRRRELHMRVDDMLAQLDLQGLASQRPDQLSGGQKQRVAFGR